MRRWIRTHLLEALLMGSAFGALVVTGVFTFRVSTGSGAQGEDLTFQGTLQELSVLLQAGGRDRLADLETVTMDVGGTTIRVDTIALTADPNEEPATLAGGFIADQVTLYNDHAIRRAVLLAWLTPGMANSADEPPSLFRTVWTEDGQRRLSDEPNPYVMIVRSPYAERGWRNVRTADWRRGGGILGLDSDIPVDSAVGDGSRARLNGRDCTLRRDRARVLVYCTAALASDVGRFFDLGFDVNPRVALGVDSAFAYRPARWQYNGATSEFGARDVRPGDVFHAPRVGPFMLSATEWGTLAASQWINGRLTFTNRPLGTLSFFASAGRSTAASAGSELILSLDAAFSLDLEHESRQFLEANAGVLRRMSVVVLDATTGALRAIAEPARRRSDEPILAFEPILVGSVVKPIVGAAILARQPSLGDLVLNPASVTASHVAGVPLRVPFGSTLNGCGSRVTFTDFIRCSINQYAAELVVRSLREDGFTPTGDGVVPRDVLERSAIGSGLAEVFDVDAFGLRTASRTPYLWTALTGPNGESGSTTGNRALMPWEPRPWIVFPNTDGTPVDWLARYAFGGWENRWTLIGVAEAYARIASGREVRATVLDVAETPRDFAPHIDSALARVRTGLRRVVVDGTAAGLASRVTAAGLPGTVVVMAKTGMLNEETDRFRALAMGIGVPAGAESNAELRCGLIVVAYFDLSADPRVAPNRLPAIHLDFARTALPRVLGRHWDRVSGCADDPAEGAR